MIGKIIYGQGNTKHKTSEQIATLQRNNPITHHTRITNKSPPKIQSYHVSGKVEVFKTYSKIKDGNTVVYDNDTHSVALTVQASSTEEAIKQFNIEVQSSFNT